jgi:hypothetical protein
MATLFRPVGLLEMGLLWDSGFREFPPRLPHQPIFYPVANRDYARQIASQWNVNDEASAYCGFVTKFAISEKFLGKFEPKTVGASSHIEYWIPADQLKQLNLAIQGSVSVEEGFFGSAFLGHIPERFGLKGKNAIEQFVLLACSLDYSPMDFICEISANSKTIYLNFWFWLGHDFSIAGIDENRKATVLNGIRTAWSRSQHSVNPPQSLTDPGITLPLVL